MKDYVYARLTRKQMRAADDALSNLLRGLPPTVKDREALFLLRRAMIAALDGTA